MPRTLLPRVLLCFAFQLPAVPAMAAAWIDESFETYADHKELLAAWPFEGEHQDARVTDEQCAGRGTHSLMELPNEDSRHVRVFDATNSVNGTHDCPLHMSYGLFQKEPVDKSFRTCELVNTRTGDRIGIGPAIHSTYLQVFDGTAWRDLAYAPERAAGWTSFDVVIKSDRLCITVTNAKGRGYEEVARATHAGFGALAIGSGRANNSAPSYVDNVILDGGTLQNADLLHPCAAALGPPEMAYVHRANSAIRRLYVTGQAKEVLADLESMLDELEGSAVVDKARAQRVLPWIYEAVATAKSVLDAPSEELQAIHYQAIVSGPDGIGARAAVRNLAQLLREPQRTHCVVNLCRQMKDTNAARAAAGLLLDGQMDEPASATSNKLRDLADSGASPLLPAAVLWGSQPIPIAARSGRSLMVQLESFPGLADGGVILSRYADRLAVEGDVEGLEGLARWTEGSGNGPYQGGVRERLCRARSAVGDVWGSLAAVCSRPLGDERAGWLGEIAEAADAEAVRGLLSDLVERAVKAKAAFPEPPGDLPPPQTPEEMVWRALACESERCGLLRAAAVAYQQLGRTGERIAAVDGARLDERFAPPGVHPRAMVDFWKAQWLVARNRLWQAEPLLAGLAQAEDAVLRSQAAFELARLRCSQHRPQAASRPAADCESLLPNSPAVRDLKARIAQDLARADAHRESYEALDAAWAQIRQTRDADRAAAALIAVSEIESRLNSPERAAEALEVLIAKYPDAAVMPAGLDRLARVYEQDLQRPDKARAVRERLTREYPEYQPAPATNPD